MGHYGIGVRETSKAAYTELKESGKVDSQCAIILATVKDRHSGLQNGWIKQLLDWSLRELCQATGIDINAMSARCFELKELGLIEEAPQRKCSISGRTINPLRIPAVGQKALFT